MIWSRKIEDIIWSIFYRYDIKQQEEPQKRLKRICMNELNAHPAIKDELKTAAQIEFFVIQMALANVSD